MDLPIARILPMMEVLGVVRVMLEVVLLEVDVALDGVGVYFYGINHYFLPAVIREGTDSQYFCCFDGFLVGSDRC